MHRSNPNAPSLSERLRSFSNRYSSNPDANADDNGGFRPTSTANRKFDRERGDSVEKEGSPGFESGVTRGVYSRAREGSSGRSVEGSERGSYYGSTSSLSSSSSRYGIQERATAAASNGHGTGTGGGPAGDGSGGLGHGHPPRLSSKREAREAFFTKQQEMAAPKFDPSLLRERERGEKEYREKEKSAHSGTTGGHAPAGGQGLGTKEMDGYVGFANLPNQVYRKSVKRGFEFTLMVVGESGLGKSTLINSMFLADLYSADYPGPSHRIKKTVNADATQVLLKEGGVQLRLTVVDTPGFGDAVDNSNCWQPVTEYIENKYDEYLNAESRVNRKTMPDNRVHCCLYFISPNGHGLKPLDVEFMKRLHDKVNIIPLIAKADTLTPDECREFKKTILNEIAQHKIKIYEFPEADDEEENKLQKKLKDRVPFAVVGSNAVVEVQGRKVRGRMYPWGIVEVENLEHNDFIALRNMLIRTYLQDLKDVTNNVHYENFRYNKLASVSAGGKNKNTSGKNPLVMMEDERREHVAKMKKMEAEMEQVFEMKVKEKKHKLKDSELDLQRRAEQMKKSLEQQQKELDEKRRTFEKERAMWEEQQRQLEEQRRRSLENAKENSKKDKKKSLF